MEKQRLLDTLDALRAEIAQASQVDPEMIAELRRLTEELRESTDDAADDAEVPPQPAHGLRDLLLQFEADHPQFSDAVGKAADALAAMGF